MMEVQVEWLQASCEECGFAFESMIVSRIGLLCGQTVKNETAVLDGLQDPVVEEVERLVRQVEGEWGTTREHSHELFKRVVGYVCDAAPSGRRYDFGDTVWCPRCGRRPKAWGPHDSAKVEWLDLPVATHHHWDGLPPTERYALIVSALKHEGGLPILI